MLNSNIPSQIHLILESLGGLSLINSKFNNETKNYNDIEDFLKHLNIDNYIINKIIFLDFNSLNDILLTDDEIFEKNDIAKETITYIKNKIQEELYVLSLDI